MKWSRRQAHTNWRLVCAWRVLCVCVIKNRLCCHNRGGEGGSPLVPHPSNIRSVLSNIRSVLSNIRSVLINIRSVLSNIRSVLSNIRSVLSNIRSVLSNIRSVLSNIRSVLGKTKLRENLDTCEKSVFVPTLLSAVAKLSVLKNIFTICVCSTALLEKFSLECTCFQYTGVECYWTTSQICYGKLQSCNIYTILPNCFEKHLLFW
jgi:hypothetical protein